VDQILLELVSCPDQHKTRLTYDPAARSFTCPDCGRVFGLSPEGVPVLLLDEARPAGGER